MKHKAFSLIEVLVAITILTVGILSAFTLVPLGIRMSSSTENETIALNLAQGVIDDSINKNYDQIIPTDTGLIDYTSDTDSPFYHFKQQKVIEWIDSDFNHSATDTGLKKITVTIYWQNGSQQKNYSLVTTVAKK